MLISVSVSSRAVKVARAKRFGKTGAVMKRSTLIGLRMLLALAAVGSVAFAPDYVSAQEKQKYSFKQPADAGLEVH